MSNTPIDIKAPDALFDHLNERAEANRADTEKREVAKAANRARVQKAKRRGWRITLIHWIIYYCGLGCMVFLAFLLGMPGWVAAAIAVLNITECLFRLRAVIRAYPKK